MKNNETYFNCIYFYPSKAVVHKLSDSTYGMVFFVNDNIYFCKHKAVEINKTQKVPKFITKIQETWKTITQKDLEENYVEVNPLQISYLESVEENIIADNTLNLNKNE